METNTFARLTEGIEKKDSVIDFYIRELMNDIFLLLKIQVDTWKGDQRYDEKMDELTSSLNNLTALRQDLISLRDDILEFHPKGVVCEK